MPTDARVFQNKPPSADLPSADGDITKISREELATLVGRKRNAYGKGLGDVALPKGQTVGTQINSLLSEALRRRGYATDATTGPRSCRSSIKEYWAWMRPGFWEIAVEARVTLYVTLAGPSGTRSFEVTGFGRDQSMVGGSGMYQKAYAIAFEELLGKLDAELAKAGV
jgi:hypothetical protein